jgi:multidrug efflux pump subunit AcrA (membrane-fusion protein)
VGGHLKFWKIFAVPLIISALALTAACSATAQPVRQIQQVQVTRGDLETKISGNGKVAIVNDAKLAFGSGGKLTTLNVAEGDRVTKGAATLIPTLTLSNLLSPPMQPSLRPRCRPEKRMPGLPLH